MKLALASAYAHHTLLAFMVSSLQKKLEREEFLVAPALFKHGPWLLLVVGVVIASLVVGAALWRIQEGRSGEYEKTFANATATAAAAKENLEQLLGRLNDAASYLDSVSKGRSQASRHEQLYLTELLLQGWPWQSVALSKRNEVLSAAKASKETIALAVRAAEDPQSQALNPGGQVMLPAGRITPDGRLLVPIVQRLRHNRFVERIVFLVDERTLTGAIRREFGHEGGWLRIENSGGHVVLDTLVASSRPGIEGKSSEKLFTPRQAMQGPLDYDSQRLLVGNAPRTAGGPYAMVGITEAAALQAARKRIAATWVIAAFVLPVLGSLGLTSVALRRFAEVERYLRRLARSDDLTELPNRRRFHALLEKAVAHSQATTEPLALLFVDLDNFKFVNDSLGHSEGDALLKHVARVLQDVVRAADAVCRLGGDEFTVIANNVADATEAKELGNRILDRLKHHPTFLEGTGLRPKASIGIALMPQSARSAEDLMRFADTAMYRAKSEGKDCCRVYDESMAAQEMTKASLVEELERGIPANELFLDYQPKFELATGRLVGHEALVRWNHPKRGVVYPGEFIGLAEESGLIIELGNWVLDRAVAQIRDWERQGHGQHQIAVNVSGLQLRRADFVEQVMGALSRYNVTGALLQLEITESVLAADAEQVKLMLARLHDAGVLVAVDDFGIGYSSLGALQQFKLDTLKVDRSFISAIHTTQGEAVCRAVVTMGHALGMRVIAEGVETLGQAQTLARLGCDQVQGYYFAKPMAAQLACKTGSVRGIGLRRII